MFNLKFLCLCDYGNYDVFSYLFQLNTVQLVLASDGTASFREDCTALAEKQDPKKQGFGSVFVSMVPDPAPILNKYSDPTFFPSLTEFFFLLLLQFLNCFEILDIFKCVRIRTTNTDQYPEGPWIRIQYGFGSKTLSSMADNYICQHLWFARTRKSQN